jgi:hypothetical protein
MLRFCAPGANRRDFAEQYMLGGTCGHGRDVVAPINEGVCARDGIIHGQAGRIAQRISVGGQLGALQKQRPDTCRFKADAYVWLSV